MSVDNFSRINNGFICGLFLLVTLPTVAFLFSFFGGDGLIELVYVDRALRTDFPKSASIFIFFGLLALLISHIPLFFGILQISLDKLAIFRDSVMWSIHKKGRPYRVGQLAMVILLSIATIAIFVFGPVDMRIMCASGVCISRNPWIFIISQNILLCLAYICNGCALFWLVAYFKLRGLNEF
ncbi:hypothetical protein [Xanthomonas graminis]|uniref:hypothetical protein n=1 Tax=Xanthomonas graminis TaxID=3390026 RepID=UPI0011875D28|nr:hypothetical protein [Xanthomonas translucens]UKE78411.1 hypothetical protein KM317_04010 [Xanthomonas translucens pv. arrhenatheri]